MNKVVLSLWLGTGCLMALLFWGLGQNPRALSIPLAKSMNHQLVQVLGDKKERPIKSLLVHHVTLLHVWASWCTTCQATHALWMQRKAELPRSVSLIGVSFQDSASATQRWLHRLGNPYDQVILDTKGTLGIDLGVTGTPELYLIDQHGRVRKHWVGAISDRRW